MSSRGLHYPKVEKFQNNCRMVVMIDQRKKIYDASKRRIK